jgi:hypothetical protein
LNGYKLYLQFQKNIFGLFVEIKVLPMYNLIILSKIQNMFYNDVIKILNNIIQQNSIDQIYAHCYNKHHSIRSKTLSALLHYVIFTYKFWYHRNTIY